MIEDKNIKWLDFSSENFDIYGIREEDCYRLPAEFADSVNELVSYYGKASAGGRIRFRTNSKCIYIKCNVNTNRGVSFDMYRVIDNHEVFCIGFRRFEFIWDGEVDYEATNLPFQDGVTMNDFTINFPYIGFISDFKLGICDDATIEHGAKYANEKPVLFYGSSITHGAWATRTGNTYPSLISQKYNMDYINFGFSGGARGEKSIIDYMANMDIGGFVSDFDHNCYVYDDFKTAHPLLYRTIREKHPDIPYIIISRPDYYENPPTNDKRMLIIEGTYNEALKNGDKNVYFINGRTLLAGEYYHNCTKDGCHPNDLGFYRMASIIGPVIAKAMGFAEPEHHDYVEF